MLADDLFWSIKHYTTAAIDHQRWNSEQTGAICYHAETELASKLAKLQKRLEKVEEETAHAFDVAKLANNEAHVARSEAAR